MSLPCDKSQIFVGGLHYETRDASLQSYFEQFGPVTTAEVMFNRETHKSRGFGFVVFENEESANAVLQSTHHTVNGKVVEVKRAVPRSQSSTGGSNPSSPAMMGYPPSPSSALGSSTGGGMMSKTSTVAAAAVAGPKRAQRPRTMRDAMMSPNGGAGHVPPGASPQHRGAYPPTTSYATVLRYGAGRQPPSNVGPGGGGKPPQHHGHMQGREDMGNFRLHGSHENFPPSATARAQAAAAHAFVQELKAWDVENPGGGLNFDDSFDYYAEQRAAPREYSSHVDMGGADGSYSTTLQGSSTWPGPGPGSGPHSRSWAQQQGQGGPNRQQVLRQTTDSARMSAHNSRAEDTSPRYGGQYSTFHRHSETVLGPESADPHSHLYRSNVSHNGEDYNNGHGHKTLGESQNTRLLSPGEGGGTPALMGSSPLLGGGGLLETAFAELSLDGNQQPGLNASLTEGGVPNGDGPSLLSEIGGGGPPSSSSEVLPYGRAGGETAVDEGSATDGLGGSGSWRADAFGSALGVNVASTVASTANEAGERGPLNEGEHIRARGLGEQFLSALGSANTENPNHQIRWR